MKLKKKKILNNHGFTLLEVIIYIGILGMILVAFVYFAISISNIRTKNYVKQEVQANARMAMNLITQRIKAANGINAGLSTFDSDPGELSLSMADSLNNPTIINLDQDDGILQIKEVSDAPVALTSDEVKVTNLVFTDLSSSNTKGNIRVDISINYADNGDQAYNYSMTLQSSANLRQ